MNDPFVQSEWGLLCDRLRQCAKGIARDEDEFEKFQEQQRAFAEQDAPQRYRDLLNLTAAAARLAVSWQETRHADIVHEEEMIDETLDESFPASDPPSFTHAHA
tara:strand:+ start:283395 stop:283706 length:312 start_codon:yes stop_codon:yes gene_type:complete